MPKSKHSATRVAKALVRERAVEDARQNAALLVTRQPGEDSTPLEAGWQGRLNVQVVREMEFHVPVTKTEGPKDFATPNNPINQTGPLFKDECPVVTEASEASFLSAFDKRSNFKALDDIPETHVSFVKEMLEGHQPFDYFDEDSDMRARWLANMPPVKRGKMEAAFLCLSDATSVHLGQKDLSVKQEALLKRNDPDWAPRIIYAGTDAFNTATGPVVNELMKRFVAMLRGVGGVRTNFLGVEVLLGYATTVENMCRFLDDPELTIAHEGDYSRNDKEQRAGVARITDALFKHLGAPRWFRALIMKVSKFVCVNRKYGFKAMIDDQLPTGTTITTLRNSWFNIVQFVYSFHSFHTREAMTRTIAPLKAKALVLGDDLLAVANLTMCARFWTEKVAEYKMVLKAALPKLHAQATFVSKRLVMDGPTPVMIPKIGKALARFNVRTKQDPLVSDSQYMAGKALSYAYEFRFMPAMCEAFLDRYAMEDQSNLSLDDLSYSTKHSGESFSNVSQVEDRIRACYKMSGQCTADFLMAAYGPQFGSTELAVLVNDMILSKSISLYETESITPLSIDF
jgi:hypothetical protein